MNSTKMEAYVQYAKEKFEDILGDCPFEIIIKETDDYYYDVDVCYTEDIDGFLREITDHYAMNYQAKELEYLICVDLVSDYIEKGKKILNPRVRPDAILCIDANRPLEWLYDEPWDWISWYSDSDEYGTLDHYYAILDESTDNDTDMTKEELRSEYDSRFPELLADALENIGKAIKKGKIRFTINHDNL